jgi:hypothetical protein
MGTDPPRERKSKCLAVLKLARAVAFLKQRKARFAGVVYDSIRIRRA